MLYFIYGSDTDAVLARGRSLVGTLLSKRPDAEVVRVTDETFDVAHIRALAGTQGLFEKKIVAVLDRVLGAGEGAVLDLLAELEGSENAFVVLADDVTAKVAEKVALHAAKVVHCDAVARAPERDFNMFALTDALGARDKKALWVLYERAKRAGASAEEVHGILFWQAKALALAASAKSAGEAGMKSFPFSKAKSFLKNFSKAEVELLPGELVTLYHDARRGSIGLDVALERFILAL